MIKAQRDCAIVNLRKFLYKRTIHNSAIRRNSDDEIEKLNKLVKQKMIEIEQLERAKAIKDSKPKLSDFKRPILQTLLIGSTAYLTFHLIWWNLEYYEREKDLNAQLKLKEEELDEVLKAHSDNSAGDRVGRRSLWSKVAFWRSN